MERLEEAHLGRFVYRGKGVDFLDTVTGMLIELTTGGQVTGHGAKGGHYRTCEYATYEFPK